jgi:hypothetical protein
MDDHHFSNIRKLKEKEKKKLTPMNIVICLAYLPYLVMFVKMDVATLNILGHIYHNCI